MQTRAEFIQDSIKLIRSLYRKKQYVDALRGCRELLNFAPGDADVLAIKEKVESAFVRNQLPLRKTFLKAQEYEKLYGFYQKLYRICPHVPEVVSLMGKCERLIQKKRAREQAVAIKNIEQKISSDFVAKRWESVRENCYEILKLDSRNRSARKLLARIGNIESREVNMLLYAKLPILRQHLIEEYHAHPDGFRRI